jgi:hypothetical protein
VYGCTVLVLPLSVLFYIGIDIDVTPQGRGAPGKASLTLAEIQIFLSSHVFDLAAASSPPAP